VLLLLVLPATGVGFTSRTVGMMLSFDKSSDVLMCYNSVVAKKFLYDR